MPNKKSILLASLVVALVQWGPASGRAQFSGQLSQLDDNIAQYSRRVAVKGRVGIPGTFESIIIPSILDRLNASDEFQQSNFELTRIELTRHDELADLELGSLWIYFKSNDPAHFAGGEEDKRSLNELDQRWNAARSALEAALRQAQSTTRARKLEIRRGEIAQLQRVHDEVAAQLDDAVSQLEAISPGQSLDELRELLADATKQMRELELDRVGGQARREAIERRIDELRGAAAKASEDDPLIAELLKIQELREQQLAVVRTRNRAGTPSGTEMDLRQAEAETALARIEVLKAQRTAAEQAAGSVLHQLNNELSSLVVRAAEIDARHKALEQSVAELAQATNVRAVAERRELDRKVRSLESQLDDYESHIERKRAEVDGSTEVFTIQPLEELLQPEKTAP